MPRARGEGPRNPGRPLPRRFRRPEGAGRTGHAAPPRTELPCPRRQGRCRYAGRAPAGLRAAGGVSVRHLCLLTCFTLVSTSFADDRSREESAEAEKLFAAELPRWQLAAGETALDNPKEPVLRWTNPAAGRVYGNT